MRGPEGVQAIEIDGRAREIGAQPENPTDTFQRSVGSSRGDPMPFIDGRELRSLSVELRDASAEPGRFLCKPALYFWIGSRGHASPPF
jgi:hypothetical protein